MSVEHLYNLLTSKNHVSMTEIIKEADKFTENIKYKGINILTMTIYFNYQNIFDLFIEKGFDVNVGNDNGIPTLIWALDSKHRHYRDTLIQHPKIDYLQEGKQDNIFTYVFSHIIDMSFFNLMNTIFKQVNFEKAKSLSKVNTSYKHSPDMYDYKKPLIFRMFQILNYILLTNPIEYEKYESVFFEKIEVAKEYNPNILYQRIHNNTILSYIVNETQIPKLKKKLLVKFTKLYFANLSKQKLNEYETCVFNTIENNNIELFKFYINLNIKLNYFQVFEKCRLHNNIDILYIFLKSEGIKYHIDLITYAINQDSVKLLEFLHQEGYELDDDTYNYVHFIKYSRPLYLAIKKGNYNVIKYILDNSGDDLDFKGRCHITPRQLLDDEYKKGILPNEIVEMIVKPILSYNKFKEETNHFECAKQCQECCICLEPINMKSHTLLECGHVFHTECIMKNCTIRNNRCPYCRQEVQIKCKSEIDLGKYVKKEKRKLKVRRNSISEGKPNILIKNDEREIREYEDSYELEMICLNEYDIYLVKIKNEKKKKLVNKMDDCILEEDIKKLKIYLSRYKIGKKKPRYKAKYTDEYQGDIYAPPNSPIPIRRKIKQTKHINKKNIIENQVEGGLRRSSRTNKGKRPNYLLNEI
jgi:hypothetical protein